MKGIFYISMNNFVNNNKNIQVKSGISKKIRKQICNIQDKYKKHIKKMIISVMFMKKIITNLVFFALHEFVLNISFLLLFTKLFTMT
jgi:hypothetical protein